MPLPARSVGTLPVVSASWHLLTQISLRAELSPNLLYSNELLTFLKPSQNKKLAASKVHGIVSYWTGQSLEQQESVVGF